MSDLEAGRAAREERLHRALAEGVRLFNQGAFFECHEVLEEVWLQETGPDKDFLQGLIKAAAAFHHFQRGTYQGMLNLLRASRDTLAPFAPARHGVELAALLTALEGWIPRARALLAEEDPGDAMALPTLRYDPPGREAGP